MSRAHLAAISELPGIRELDLSQVSGINSALDELKPLKTLEKLNLCGLDLSDTDAQALASMKNLKQLEINAKISPSNVKMIQNALPHCEVIFSNETKGPDANPIRTDPSPTPYQPFGSEKEAANWVIEHGGNRYRWKEATRRDDTDSRRSQVLRKYCFLRV